MKRRSLVVLWDFLVWVLIVFPLVTGGLWYQRPGLKLEHAQLAAPVLIVALFGWFFSKAGAELNQASSVRLARHIAALWRRALDTRPVLTLIAAATFASVLLMAVSLRRHWAFESFAFDLGIYTNGLWNLTHGNGYYSSVREMYLLADHQAFIMWLLVPLFKVAEVPETVLVIQGLGIGFGGIATWYLARQYLPRGHWATYATPVLYWAYFPFRTANTFDFHPETLMLPLYLAAITGIQSQNKVSRIFGILAMSVALLAKETAAAVAVGIGIAWLFGAGPEVSRSFTRKVALAFIPIGFALFVLDLKVIPHEVGGQHAHLQAHLNQYGGGMKDLILSPILKPHVFWPHLLNPARQKFLLHTLGPLAFLPLFAWRPFIAALPGFLMLFLTEGDHKVNITYHYAIEPGLALFWCFPVAVALAATWKPEKGIREVFRRILVFLATPTVVLFFALALFDRSPLYLIRKYSPTPEQRWIRKELIPCIDPLISVSASTGFVSHFSVRPWAHELPDLQDHKAAGPVSCVMVNHNVSNWSMDGFTWEPLDAALAKDYQQVLHCGGTTLWQLKQPAANCLVCAPSPCPVR